jgi:outer membrane protein assembly factor BamB
VFVVETKDKTFEVVRALDRDTGKELWRTQWKGAITVPPYARVHGDWIRSTPACDGDSLYVAGMRDVVVCLDARSGKERWRSELAERLHTPLPVFGCASSPLVDRDALYLQAAAAVVKLNKKTGRVLWRAFPDEGGPNGSAVASPVLSLLGGRLQLLAQNRRQLGGLDPDSGRVLWSEEVPAFNSMNILTPTVYHDSVFTSSYGGRSFLFTLSRQDDGVAVTKAWTNKAQGFMSTPVIINGHLYLHLRNQRLMCLDLKTGHECWTSPQSFGQYWSMVVQGDRILALDQRGILYLVRANPEKFELLDSRKISDAQTWAHLAVCGDQLFVRELHAVATFRWLSPPRAPSK